MCRKKYNNEVMGSYLTEVSFRLVLFSLPQFRESMVAMFTDKFPNATNFEERTITEEEQQFIDIDAVAYDLEIPLIDVLRKKTYVFKNVTIGKQDKCTVYINPHYIFIRAKLKEDEMIDEDFFNQMNLILDTSIIKRNNPQKFHCLTTHYCEIPVEQISDIMDLEAFPKIDWANFGGGNYVDNYMVNDTCSIDLKRIMERYDDEKEKPHVIINILTSAHMTNFDIDTMSESYHSLYNFSLTEVARCFKA